MDAMPRYLNGRADTALKEMTALVRGISVEEVTSEFFLREERNIARRRRAVSEELREEFQAWRKVKNASALTAG